MNENKTAKILQKNFGKQEIINFFVNKGIGGKLKKVFLPFLTAIMKVVDIS